MDDRGSRKRRLTEEAGLPISGHTAASSAPANGGPVVTPPANKRQYTGGESGNSSPLSIARDDTENMTAAESVLLSFQKEAIWRQLQDYRRESSRAQERIERLENKQAGYDSQITTVDAYWSQMLTELMTLILRSKVAISKDEMVLNDGTSFASVLLSGTRHQAPEIQDFTRNATNATEEANPERTREIALKLLQLTESWASQRNEFWTSLSGTDKVFQESSAINELTAQYNNINQQFQKGQADVDRLQAKCHGFADDVFRLRNELEMAKNRLSETTEDLDASADSLRRIEINIEREKHALGSMTSRIGAADGAMLQSTSTLADMSEASREELLQFRTLALSRLSELEEMREQRTRLRDDLEKIRIQLGHLSDDKIQDSQHVRSLLVQIQSIRHEADHHRGEVLKLRSDLDDLHASRRRFVETLEAEEKTRRATLEAELKKLESDISRVRDSRDRFQLMYENRCTKDDYEMQQNQEIRKIANTRKDRITALTAEIQRLQDMLAATSDDWESYAFYLKSPGDKATLTSLRGKLTAADMQLKSLTDELEASKEAALQTRDLTAVNTSQNELKKQTESLNARLAQLDEVLGTGADDKIKELIATIESKDEAIHRLELKVKVHETVQMPLLSELHTVANAWGQLEEATSRKAIDLAQKEDLIYKLLSDKTRQESKCISLVRAKEQSVNMTAVMKRQSDMQLDQIRRLEEREKTLNEQMVTLEKEQTVLTSEVTIHKSKLQEFTQHSSSFKDKIAKQEERLLELQTLLKERTDAHEAEAAARKRLAEESEAMRRKIEENSKKAEGSTGDSEAAKQAARYLKLLKCPACDTNFKSHVILRCMHVFCKSCMDKQMEYRQRKCPTCRENFGAKDVKEIYL
ncbi:E3 ubiquitin-protein ligase bre1 [Dissophora globulifera]|nr:E3 ubiquitin-protein ligase bre1 [Dissophora globulifera]